MKILHVLLFQKSQNSDNYYYPQNTVEGFDNIMNMSFCSFMT